MNISFSPFSENSSLFIFEGIIQHFSNWALLSLVHYFDFNCPSLILCHDLKIYCITFWCISKSYYLSMFGILVYKADFIIVYETIKNSLSLMYLYTLDSIKSFVRKLKTCTFSIKMSCYNISKVKILSCQSPLSSEHYWIY